jgi:hypothetical protein
VWCPGTIVGLQERVSFMVIGTERAPKKSGKVQREKGILEGRRVFQEGNIIFGK